MPIRMTRDLAYRASVDHGNHSMYAAGRTAWDEEDYDAAVLMFNTLWPLCPHKIDLDDWCRYCDSVEATRPRSSSPTIS